MNLGVVLYIGGQDLGVMHEVNGECVALPPALDLHHIEWDSAKEVFEGGPDADAVPLEGIEAGGSGCLGDMFEELRLREGAVRLLELVREEVGVDGRVVDVKVVFEGSFGICLA